MASNVEIFENSEFGSIRTIEEDGKVLFCGSDVAKALGYTNPTKAINDHCRGIAERRTNDSLGRQQNMKFIPEGDIYRLAAKSELPSAEKFESWIFDDVLPTIRKHGAYMTSEKIEEALLNPDIIIKLATELKTEREQRKAAQAQLEANKPKVLFADAVCASQTSILVGDLAKLLKQNGISMGQNRLFAYLRDNDYLMKQGSSKNMPTQRSMDMGLFEVKENYINNPDGSIRITRTTKVTGKGQVYFINKLKSV